MSEMQKEFEKYVQNLNSYKLDFEKTKEGLYRSREVAMFFAVWATAYSYAKEESIRQILESQKG